METRKTNLGVEYELELVSYGKSSIELLATLPNNSEFKSFDISLGRQLTPSEINEMEDKDIIPWMHECDRVETEQYINEQAIMYVSMELAKLMGDGTIEYFSICNELNLEVGIINKSSVENYAIGLAQIEELIKQIRYS